MIKVDRSLTPKELKFDDPLSGAYKERQVILDHIAEHGQLPAKPNFEVFRSPGVKEELVRIFKGKCAYCEVYTAAGFDGDVEHYRPKRGVSDASAAGVKHPGYWWLAMAWENLVLSCQHCNQSRKQLIHAPGQDEATIARELLEDRRRTTGKLNRFPVKNNAWVTSHLSNLANEQPLLIDPSAEDPEPLLDWEFERSISTVKPKNGDVRAAATIEILGLNRRHLTEARVAVLNQFRAKRLRILKLLSRIADPDTSDETAAALRDVVMAELDELAASCQPNSQFAGMAKAYRAKLAAEVADRML